MPRNNDINGLIDILSGGSADTELLFTMLQADIAASIAASRIDKGMSQKDLAESLGVSQALVSRWENGETNYTLETLVRIAVNLDIPLHSPYEIPRAPRLWASSNVIEFTPSRNRSSSSCSGWSARSFSSNYELKEM